VRGPSTFTIPKAVNPEQVTENAGAGELLPRARELACIDKAFPLGRAPRELPML
jgi:diketogulonate reductase-like aldo/keto reductase